MRSREKITTMRAIDLLTSEWRAGRPILNLESRRSRHQKMRRITSKMPVRSLPVFLQTNGEILWTKNLMR